MRVVKHPILGEKEMKPKIKFWFNGECLEAEEGEPIAASLLANGIRVHRLTTKRHEPRGIFCGIGQCTDCMMEVDGRPNVRTCITPVREGMIVKTQDGLGKWEAK